jgi:hypothetical protein
MSFQINYSLGNSGWADCTFSNAGQSCGMTVSYLHDSLGELITSANLLIQGVQEAKVLFMDEPGEHMVFLQVDESGVLNIEIRWFDDWASWDLITSKEYKVVFNVKENIIAFCKEVFRTSQDILDKNGLRGYREKWGNHDFPSEGFERLKQLLSGERTAGI